MKDKIKDTFQVVLYIGGLFIVTGLWLSLTEGDLSDTTIGKIVQTLGAIAGLCIFGFLAFCYGATIYAAIRDYIKRKIREEARKVIAEEKRLEKLLNKEKENEKN